jgi:hypothetical protein
MPPLCARNCAIHEPAAGRSNSRSSAQKTSLPLTNVGNEVGSDLEGALQIRLRAFAAVFYLVNPSNGVM